MVSIWLEHPRQTASNGGFLRQIRTSVYMKSNTYNFSKWRTQSKHLFVVAMFLEIPATVTAQQSRCERTSPTTGIFAANMSPILMASVNQALVYCRSVIRGFCCLFITLKWTQSLKGFCNPIEIVR